MVQKGSSTLTFSSTPAGWGSPPLQAPAPHTSRRAGDGSPRMEWAMAHRGDDPCPGAPCCSNVVLPVSVLPCDVELQGRTDISRPSLLEEQQQQGDNWTLGSTSSSSGFDRMTVVTAESPHGYFTLLPKSLPQSQFNMFTIDRASFNIYRAVWCFRKTCTAVLQNITRARWHPHSSLSGYALSQANARNSCTS